MSLAPAAPIPRPKHRAEQYSCEVCEYSSTDKTKMMLHYRLHAAGDEECSFRCAFCPVLFSEKSQFITHMMSGQHAADRAMLSVSELETLLASNQIAKSSISNDNELDGAVYSCRTCGQQATGESGIARHALTHFTATAAIKCPYCNYSAAQTQVDIAMHIVRLHPETAVANALSKASSSPPSSVERGTAGITSSGYSHQKIGIFSCRECSYQSESKPLFDRHMKIHAEKPPFLCPFCVIVCQSSTARKFHMFRLHPDLVFNTPDAELAQLLTNNTSTAAKPTQAKGADLPPQRAAMPKAANSRTMLPHATKQKILPTPARKTPSSRDISVPIAASTLSSNRVSKPRGRSSVYKESAIQDGRDGTVMLQGTRGKYACSNCRLKTDVDYELLAHKRSRSCLHGGAK